MKRVTGRLGVEVTTWNNVNQMFVDYGKGNYAPTELGNVFREYNQQQQRRRPSELEAVE